MFEGCVNPHGAVVNTALESQHVRGTVAHVWRVCRVARRTTVVGHASFGGANARQKQRHLVSFVLFVLRRRVGQTVFEDQAPTITSVCRTARPTSKGEQLDRRGKTYPSVAPLRRLQSEQSS